MSDAGDTHNQVFGNAEVIVQARTIVGGVHVRVERGLSPISARAFVAWLVIAAVPLTGAVAAGQYGLAHVHEGLGLVALGVAALAGLLAVRIGTVVWEWRVLSREQQGDVLERRLDRAARGLALTLREQWRTEERLPRHRLQDPRPLPVKWLGDTDYEVFLDGTFEDIVKTFDRVRSRRLVVLGPAGAGKSVLARRFALQWLTRELEGERLGRVPVLLSLSSWDPGEELHSWAATRLASEHPALGQPVLAGGTVAEKLLRRGRLLLVLDGFDEIAEPLRAEALRQLNQAFHEDDPVLLTSRPAQYRAATKAAGVEFSAAAVVRLCPLAAADVRGYLLDSTNQPKWRPVLDQLAAENPVARALTTPLMVALARQAYSDTSADPAELLDAEQFADQDKVEQHLLDRLVPTAYKSLGGSSDRVRWRAEDAGRWLGFLARWMNAGGTQELAWWRLSGRRTRHTAAVVLAVLVGGLVAMMAALGYAASGTVPLWGVYLLLAPVPVIEAAVLAVAREVPDPTGMRFGRRQLRRLVLRLVLCVAVGLPLWSLLHLDPVFLALVAVVVLIRGVPRAPLDLSLVADPSVSLRSDRRATVVLGPWHAVTGGGRRWRAAVVLLAPLAMFSLWSQNGGQDLDLTGQWWLVAASTVVVLAGYGLLASAWGQFLLVRCVLAVRGVLPWRVLGFLADAHSRGVLRQTGGVYQFRHARLQDRLAGGGQAAKASPKPVRTGFHMPATLSVIVILFGSLALTAITVGAPGPDGPYLGFKPACAELRQELTPVFADTTASPTETPTSFDCFFDEGGSQSPSLSFSGEIKRGKDGQSALDYARDWFGYAEHSEPNTPASAATCGEPVVHVSPGYVETLCGNADLSVQYNQDSASTARRDATAVTLLKVLIGIALGEQAPAADNADARRSALQAMADQPRPLAPNSGSAHYRPGSEQAVAGAVWQPTDSTALQDVGALVFRTPRNLWCGGQIEVSPVKPAWECKSEKVTLDLAVWPCSDACGPGQVDQLDQDWEFYFHRQGVSFVDVSWQQRDPQTDYAESTNSAGDYQLVLSYLTLATDGTVLDVVAAVRADSGDADVAQKIVNDIHTQAALIAAK